MRPQAELSTGKDQDARISTLHAAAGRTGRKLNIRNESCFQQAASGGTDRLSVMCKACYNDCILCAQTAVRRAAQSRQEEDADHT